MNNFEISNKEGGIGEQLYIDYLNNQNKNFYDVRENVICQELDIDFIIPIKDNVSLDEILLNIRSGNPNQRQERQKNIGYAVEVKVDKVTHNRYKKRNGEISNGTGNLVYEVISHNMPGCLARSYADFILYVCIDTFDEYTILKKAYMINLHKWRDSMVNSDRNNQNIKLKPLKFVLENGKQVEENILNILHPVKDLLQLGNTVIIDYTDKLNPFFPTNLKLKK